MMTPKNKIIPEDILLLKIDILESNIIDANEKTEKYEMRIGSNIMHNLEHEMVKIGLTVTLNGKEVSNKCSASFAFDFQFKVNKMCNFYELKEEGTPLFSGELIATLLGLSYSTARGIIFERLANTNMQNIILPVINPNNLLKKKSQEANF